MSGRFPAHCGIYAFVVFCIYCIWLLLYFTFAAFRLHSGIKRPECSFFAASDAVFYSKGFAVPGLRSMLIQRIVLIDDLSAGDRIPDDTGKLLSQERRVGRPGGKGLLHRP